ncbi:MAG: nitroreductase family deazaflavin-dependent oxidoreductase [Pseudomonadota bacterium]
MDMNAFNKPIIEEFRANAGEVKSFPAPLLILTTKGARTGQVRENPLVFLEDGDRYIIIASFAGNPKSPPWYHNLVAHPDVQIEIGAETIQMRATVLDEPERTELYTRMETQMPTFTEYRESTDRVIPVIALTPV